jgi:hypothetical protein
MVQEPWMSKSSLGFAARWSLLVWGITAGVFAAIAAGEVLLIVAVFVASEDPTVRSLLGLAALLAAGIFATVAWFAPRGYVVRPDGIVVSRLAAPLVISYHRIREVRRIDNREMGFVMRVFGSGGFLGWFGRFVSKRLGEFHAYATNRQDLVLITKTNGRKIVISPHPPDAFVDAVRRHREQPA